MQKPECVSENNPQNLQSGYEGRQTLQPSRSDNCHGNFFRSANGVPTPIIFNPSKDRQ